MGRILDCCWSDFGCYLSDSGLLIVGLWVVIGRILGCYSVNRWVMGSYWSDSRLLLVGFWFIICQILGCYWLDYG